MVHGSIYCMQDQLWKQMSEIRHIIAMEYLKTVVLS